MLLNAKVAAIEMYQDEVRVAVVKTGGRLPVVLELQSRRAAYDDPALRAEALTAALEAALDALKHTPASYIYCANCFQCIVRHLTLPIRGKRRVTAAVQFELEPHLAFPIEDLLLDFNIVGESGGETDVLAMGLRRQDIEEDLAILGAAGIEPDAVTLDAAALTGLWFAQAKPGRGLKAVLHLRENGAAMTIVNGKSLVYFRGMNATAQDMRDNPAKAAREAQHTLRAFTAQWRGEGEFTQLHVTGAALSAEAIEMLTGTLDLEVVPTLLTARGKGAPAAMADEAAPAENANHWEACIGAAMGAQGGPFALDFKRAERGVEGVVRGVVAHLLFSSCLALLGLLCLAFYFHQGTLRNDAAAAELEGQIAAVSEEIAAVEKEGIGEGINMEMFSGPTLLDLLSEIAAKMPDSKVNLRSISISAAPASSRTPWITIQGVANNDNAFNQVFQELRESAVFDVDPDPARVLEGGLTAFTIKATRPQEKKNDASES